MNNVKNEVVSASHDGVHAKAANDHHDHHHYDHYSAAMANRLDGFYGRVDARINDLITKQVVGTSVLDIGCGFGALSEALRIAGHQAVGIDLLKDCVAEGKRRYPLADLRVAESEELAFPDKSFDTVVLKDVIHHVYEEDDVAEFLASVKRIVRKRLVIVDPNPMSILLLARRLIGHIDPVCSPKDAQRVLQEAGFRVVVLSYSETIAFPASGGYVGPILIPNSPKILGSVVLAIDSLISRFAKLFKLDRHVSWRYLLVADVA